MLRRERHSGWRSGGVAFLEFSSVDDATVALEAAERHHDRDRDGYRVVYDFAEPLRGRGSGNRGGRDWECGACGTTNFSRRDACMSCGRTRTEGEGASRVPTNTLRIGGLSQHISEADLRSLVSPYGTVANASITRDRYSATARCVAFVTFCDIEDAQSAASALEGMTPQGCETALSVAYAPDLSPERTTRAAVAGHAVAAAQAMQKTYATAELKVEVAKGSEEAGDGWQPRAFDASALDAPAASASAGAEGHAGGCEAGSGFVYDEASGYYYDAASGYFYDVNTQLYYHPNTSSWYRHNPDTGAYDVIPAETHDDAAAETASDRAAQASGGTAPLTATPSEISATPAVPVAAPSTAKAAPAAATTTAPKPAPAKSASAGLVVTDGGSLVDAWLRRKAEEQREAARDFLKSKPQQASSNIASSAKEPATAVRQTSATATVPVSAGGVVRQKVYNGAVGAGAVGQTELVGKPLMQTLAGGVVRGKVYNRSA